MSPLWVGWPLLFAAAVVPAVALIHDGWQRKRAERRDGLAALGRIHRERNEG